MIEDIEGAVPEAVEAPESEDLASQIESAVDKQERPEPKEGEEAEPRQARRDRYGRFQDREDRLAKKVAKEPVGEPSGAPEQSPAPDPAKLAVRPPPGFSVASRQAWDKEALSPQEFAAIKADIAKREGEVDAGFKRYGGLGKFAEEAEKNGTTLQNAVNDYVQVEDALRKDFLGGVEFLCQRMGVPLLAMVQGLIRKYGGQAPQGQPGQAPPQPVPQQIDPKAIADQAASVIRSEFEQRDINRQIETFASDPKNKFFENVRQDMSTLVAAGKAPDLKTAYEAACWLNPDIRQILIDEANTSKRGDSINIAARAKNAAKAVVGAPSPGSDNGDGRNTGRRRSLAEEIRSNVASQEAG